MGDICNGIAHTLTPACKKIQFEPKEMNDIFANMFMLLKYVVPCTVRQN
jgi:hypothetical protein